METFSQIWSRILDKLEEHFWAETRGWKMRDWFEEIKKEKTKEEVDFFEIRFEWTVDAFVYFDRKANQYDNSFDKYLGFSAMAKSKEEGNEAE